MSDKPIHESRQARRHREREEEKKARRLTKWGERMDADPEYKAKLKAEVEAMLLGFARASGITVEDVTDPLPQPSKQNGPSIQEHEETATDAVALQDKGPDKSAAL
jgi:hypothetical protein